MPELPEVETIVRSLSPKLIGLEIAGIKINYLRILRSKNLSQVRALNGRRIINIRRRGKMILIHCEGNLSLLVHLKMTGQFLFCPKEEPMDKHTHCVISFTRTSHELRFRDARKFGFISCLRTSDIDSAKELSGLGPEPLEMDYHLFRKLFQGRKARLKSLLLNQNFLAGIGNIYADEILFQAKLHPLCPASCLDESDLKRLWKSIKAVLEKALVHKGSSIRSFMDAEGQRGNFQMYHQVYGRESCPCSVCGEFIRRLRLGGRSSFFCPGCQRISSSD